MSNIFLIRNVSLEKYGGGETYQLVLAEKLSQYGFKPYIITSSRKLLSEAKRRKISTIEAPYINRQNWSGWRNILFPLYAVRILQLRCWYRKIFKKYNPQVINIQSRDDWIAATGVAKRMGIEVLWTDHMDFRSWVLVNVNVWYKNWIGKWILKYAKKADNIIMISDFERKSFEKVVKPRKYRNLMTVKNGSVDRFDELREIKAVKNSFCYVGRVVDYKGIIELIEAFKIVSSNISDAKLNIYGDGDITYFRKIAGKEENIKFHGRTDNPLKVLAENDVFVLPSYREGLSLSLLDAAMMGKKIIASDIDGNPEVVVNERTGLLVPVKNVTKLAEAMTYMLKNKKEAGKMSKNAREFYKKNFDFDKIFKEKMLPLYNIEKEKK